MLDQPEQDEVLVVAPRVEVDLDLGQRVDRLKSQLRDEEKRVTDKKVRRGRPKRYLEAVSFMDGLGEVEVTALEEAMALNQKSELRKTGEPSIYHCISVSTIV